MLLYVSLVCVAQISKSNPVSSKLVSLQLSCNCCPTFQKATSYIPLLKCMKFRSIDPGLQCANEHTHIQEWSQLRASFSLCPLFVSNCVSLRDCVFCMCSWTVCVCERQRDKWRTPHDFTKRFPVWTWALRGLLWQIGLLPLFTLQP